MSESAPRLALIGCGEAGRALAEGWAAAGVAHVLSGFDIDPQRSLAPSRQQALDGAAAVFCLVTAESAGAALEQAAPHLPAGALVLDGNSCAPQSKRANARLVAAAGGRYVDMAIMAPVQPRLHRTPMLLSGPHAGPAAALLTRLDMVAEVIEGPVGAAASVKMIRSVMIKGMEALSAECLLAARRAGVEARVLESLEASWPGFGLAERAGYNLERMIAHGIRRAAEMREVAATLRDLGLPDSMAQATAAWQQAIGALGCAPGNTDRAANADAILARLPPGGQPPAPRSTGAKKKPAGP